jgi:hypothetical protein
MTALGPIDLTRSHAYCRDCGQPGFAADALLGVDGWMTTRAKSMACLAGVNKPFEPAEELLLGLAGWTVSGETIRRRCHEAAAQARELRPQLQGVPRQFAEAEGQERELHVDAGKVNTPGGFRDVKVAVHTTRERGEPATSEDYEQRDLPAPSARSVVAEIEEAQEFGQRCQDEARRLGILPQEAGCEVLASSGLSVLGDGAEWIWNLADARFVGASQTLDVYHGVEKLAEAGREGLGTGEPMQEWLEGARQKLVADGYSGVCEVLATPVGDEEGQKRMQAKAPEVLNYFCGHRDRLGYAARLLRGQAIGSGLVEGTIKQRVNLRMKRGGARWLPEHVGPFVELMAMVDTPEWAEFWALVAA